MAQTTTAEEYSSPEGRTKEEGPKRPRPERPLEEEIQTIQRRTEMLLRGFSHAHDVSGLQNLPFAQHVLARSGTLKFSSAVSVVKRDANGEGPSYYDIVTTALPKTPDRQMFWKSVEPKSIGEQRFLEYGKTLESFGSIPFVSAAFRSLYRRLMREPTDLAQIHLDRLEEVRPQNLARTLDRSDGDFRIYENDRMEKAARIESKLQNAVLRVEMRIKRIQSTLAEVSLLAKNNNTGVLNVIDAFVRMYPARKNDAEALQKTLRSVSHIRWQKLIGDWVRNETKGLNDLVESIPSLPASLSPQKPR